ncbi:NAD(P)/FAD-dependent oxidoreductase [Paenibacillus albicereus]|uniref:NAD(P)/FAD-dependent oxidoreductase n=1 Tax=Paenibacillus albicereus TaxID=2726185 RepID=A0A6H2GXS8_9BACL|nr:NAD(P)/FAD-dependent oxidoreductase [Paenibacillus albicereus]QJC51976.1 NAD(P)/FAD-dependent oxidoreductase [Paenibacillus albicereus]
MLDVLVCGGGPAGSALAWRLARLGMRVAIADAGRHPRRKPCGESLNPGAAAALRRLAQDGQAGGDPSWDELQGELQPLEGWALHCGSARLEARYPGGAAGWSCRRERLDGWLLERAVAAGAVLLPECRVKEVRQGGSGCEIKAIREGRPVKLAARYVVGADGIRSAVARSAGLAAPPGPLRKVALTGRIAGLADLEPLVELHLEPGALIGLAPLAGGEANATLVLPAAAAASSAAALRHGRPALLAALRASPTLAARALQAEASGEALACGPFDAPVRSACSGRVLLVGDAAGYYDPLTGQGLFRALRGAELAASALADARHAGDARPLQAYGSQLRREFGPGAALQRWIEYGASRPRLFRAALAGIRWSGTAERLASRIGDCPPGAEFRRTRLR